MVHSGPSGEHKIGVAGMAYCSRCGLQLQEGMAFCGRCGAAVAQMPATAPPVQYSAVEEQGTAAPLQQTYQQAYQQPIQGQLPPPAVYPAQPPYLAQGQYPPQGAYPLQGTYLPPQTRPRPQFNWNISISRQDVLGWLRDGAILSVVAVVLGFVAALVFGLFLPSGNHGNPAQWCVAGVLIVGMALGGHVSLDQSFGGVSYLPGSSTDSGPFAMNSQIDGRVSVLLVTIAVLVAVRFVARRPERRKPSATLQELTARTLGTTVVFIAVMVILALVINIHAIYGSTLGGTGNSGGFSSPDVTEVPVFDSPTLTLSAGSMLLWPLLLVAVVSWGSAFAVWLHRSATTTPPNPTAVKLAWLWPFRPAFLAVRAQILVTAVLAGVGTYVYAIVHILQSASQQGGSGGATTRTVLGLLLGLPNLAALAGTAALGVTVNGPDAVSLSGGSAGTGIGFFGTEHPAILYALLAASLLGVVGAGKWAADKSWDHSRALLGPAQAWRGAVIGAVLWTAVGFAAQMSLGSSAGDGFGGEIDAIGPSLPGLLLGGAVWGLATGLAVSFFAGHLKADPNPAVAPVVAPAPAPVAPQGFGQQYSFTPQPAPGLGLAPAFAAAGGDGGGALIPPQAQPMVTEDPDVIAMDLVVTLAPPDEYDEYGEDEE